MSGDLNLIAAGVARAFGEAQQRDDPLAWCEARGVFLWSAQREVLQGLMDNRQVAAPSGHGVGKSYLAAVLMAWAGDTALADDTLALTTAPTAPQLMNIWRPFRHLHETLGLRGRVTGGPVPGWHIDGHQVAVGRSTRDTNRHDLAGYHAERLILLVDEADGVSTDVWEQIGSMMSGDANRLLSLGNPRNPNSAWRARIRKGKWFLRPISQLESPNLTGEVVPESLAAQLPTETTLNERRDEYGEGSPLWQSRVAGVWPTDAERQVVTEIQLESAIRFPDEREEDQHCHGDDKPLYSVDVARGGSDRTVIARVVNREFSVIDDAVGQDIVQTADKIVGLLGGHPGARVVVDAGGVGGGVIDVLKAAGLQSRYMDFDGGSGARETRQFANKRAEAMWAIGKVLDSGRLRISPGTKHLRELRTEVLSPSYFEDKHGRIVIEKKDDVKRRIGRSPDLADTLMMACWALGPALRQPGSAGASVRSGLSRAAVAERRGSRFGVTRSSMRRRENEGFDYRGPGLPIDPVIRWVKRPE